MSKIAAYLQEHIQGEVTISPSVLKKMSTDGSVLEMTPEMVLYPRVTNDIRKLLRFTWQLAEKGHILSTTPRGSGSDITGAAIGKGVILSLAAYMNRALELDTKQRLVRVQPGMSTQALNDMLLFHGMSIPALSTPLPNQTVGGAVANNRNSFFSGKYGPTGGATHQLEVVVASGDVLQTERLSKRDLSKKKGLQGFEGDIYRELDNLIEDNRELIQKFASDVQDNAGYHAIADVKRADGSFDLTPLIVGSQGTLGVISEMIMRAEYVSTDTSAMVLVFSNPETARDTLDNLDQFEPAFLEWYDGAFIAAAASQGKKYSFLQEGAPDQVAAVILLGFDDFSDRARHKKIKKISKLLPDDVFAVTADGDDVDELLTLRSISHFVTAPIKRDISTTALLGGAYVPRERSEEFMKSIAALEVAYHVRLPLQNSVLENLWYTWPEFQLHKVSDKQKIFKLLDEYASVVEAHGGHLIGQDGEGRLKANVAHQVFDDETRALFVAIKNIFDPYGTLNPGVKQTVDMRGLTSHIRSDYTGISESGLLPYR